MRLSAAAAAHAAAAAAAAAASAERGGGAGALGGRLRRAVPPRLLVLLYVVVGVVVVVVATRTLNVSVIVETETVTETPTVTTTTSAPTPAVSKLEETQTTTKPSAAPTTTTSSPFTPRSKLTWDKGTNAPRPATLTEFETATGTWRGPDARCDDPSSPEGFRLSCTPNAFAFDIPGWDFMDGPEACAMLVAKNIRTVHLLGDSFFRHLHISLVDTLRRNYSTGALKDSHKQKCADERQYDDRSCRDAIVRYPRVCDGRVQLALFEQYAPLPYPELFEKDSVVIWSIGNHPLTTHSNRKYMYNSGFFESSIIPATCNAKLGPPALVGNRLFWSPLHYSLDEAQATRKLVRAYNDATSALVPARCFGARVLDLATFTTPLVEFPDVLGSRVLTYDGYHWSRTVNLVKAQLVLATLARAHF